MMVSKKEINGPRDGARGLVFQPVVEEAFVNRVLKEKNELVIRIAGGSVQAEAAASAKALR